MAASDSQSSSVRWSNTVHKSPRHVVEALISATFSDTDGDLEAARKCIRHLVSAVPLTDPPIPTRPQIPASAAASTIDAERLTGRTFDQKTLLLKALTLNSAGSQTHVESCQRLEFLSDAVFDLLVVTRLLRHQQNTNTLTQSKLTRLRAALVNAHLLGYFNLHFRLSLQSPPNTPILRLATFKLRQRRFTCPCGISSAVIPMI